MSASPRRRSLVYSLLGTLALVSVAVHAQKAAAPVLTDVLGKGSDYLSQYATRISGLECEETYIQREVSGSTLTGTRQLKSDLLFVGIDGHIASYRDVFESVGSTIRPHEHRLLKLMGSPTVVQQAQQLDDQGTQYLFRELQQIPKSTSALEFLVGSNQSRSTFKIDNVKTSGAEQIVTLKFNEQTMPRIVDSAEHGAASGRITLDAATGSMRRTEFLLTTKTADIRVVVAYTLDPKLNLWLPASTDEHYEFTFSTAASGQATVMGSGSYLQTASFEGRALFAKCQLPTKPGS